MSEDQDPTKSENVTLGLHTTEIPAGLKHHLITAVYNWCNEEGHTPYITVYVLAKGEPPSFLKHLKQHIVNNQITFNLHPNAVVGLVIDKDAVSFNARFGGRQIAITFTVDCIIGVYSKETRTGFFFPVVHTATTHSPTVPEQSVPQRPKGRPTLSIVQ